MPSSKVEAPTESAFVCDCDEFMRSACAGEPFYGEHNGKRYCVFHYPGEEKAAAFNAAFANKVVAGHKNFHGVWFPKEVELYKTDWFDGDFSFAVFNGRVRCYKTNFGGGVRFTGAQFHGQVLLDRCTFGSLIEFRHTVFHDKVTFNGPTFEGDAGLAFDSSVFKSESSFAGCTFGEWVNFSWAKFHAHANFQGATFTNVTFANVAFDAGVSFDYAVFRREASFFNAAFADYVRFSGGRRKKPFGRESSLDFHFAKVEKPERVSFHTLMLRPHWFVNVDARKFEFINVTWRDDFKRELAGLGGRGVTSAYQLLSVACRNLAVNAEENHRYAEASRFRYLSMEARRLERWRGFAVWKLGWWFWLASGYSERAGRAFFVLLGLLLLFAALYVGLGYPNWGATVATEKATAEVPHKEADGWARWSGALLYSGGVMTLQKPEPRPATNAAQALVMLETILGPVQAALLALAIRRKFMR